MTASSPLFIPFEAPAAALADSFYQLAAAAPDAYPTTVTPHTHYPHAASVSSDSFIVASWHTGGHYTYIVSGPVADLSRYCDLTSEERERAILTERKYQARTAHAIASTSATHKGLTVAQLKKLHPLRLDGLVVL